LAASSVTFSPVLPIGPFDDALLGLALVVLDLALVVLDEPFLLLVAALLPLVLDEPFLLVDLFPLELLRRERVPEGRVVFVAIFLASLWLPCQLRDSRRRCQVDYPVE
jgi:hypothetical protein